MSLDMNVRHQENFTTDSNGNNRWETVMLGNLDGCWKVYEALGGLTELGFPNCSTMNFTLDQLKHVLEELKEEVKEEAGTDNIRELQENIKALQELVDKLSKDYEDEEPFEVHVWY